MPRLRLKARPSSPLALLISLVAGLALSLAFPPVGWWPVAFVALAPLLWLLSGARPGQGFWLGLAFGVGSFGAILYWIWLFGSAAWVALTFVSALSIALFGVVAPLIRRSGHPILTAMGWAAAWTAIDWVRGMWPLGGFTWGSLGVSQVENRVVLPLATVTGVWGITCVVVAVNGLIAASVDAGAGVGSHTWVRRHVWAAAVAAVLLLLPGLIPFARAEGATLDVATIQVDVRRAEAPSSSAEDLGVAQLNLDQHSGLRTDPPDLAVWGEGALDPAAAADPDVTAAVRTAIAAVGSPTLVGAVTDDPDGRQRTDVLLFDGEGRQVDRYDKVHLVPFGELVPFRDELSWIRALDQIPIDRAPGERVHTVTANGLPPFGSPICYENAFPALTRAFVREGAGFLIVTVNNASYGLTAASDQHLQMSRMRAVEDGRWIVNAAVSGISAFVDPQGRIVAQEGLFRAGILRGTIRSSDARTWYVRLGDWLPWLALAFAAGMILTPRRRRRARPAPEPLEGAGTPGHVRTLVILPTFDESATVARVLGGVLSLAERVDALVVDDSSSDGTGAIVAALEANEPRLRLIERSTKMGLASAYLEGFRIGLEEGYDLIVEMDSDLSHDPSELPELLHAAATRFDLTIGSRYMPGGSVTNWSRGRVALSRGANGYARFMLGVPVRDATSGYRVYRRTLLQDLVREPFHSNGYGFQIELVMRAWNLGYALGESPITFREREHGQSKISRRIVAEALWLVTTWGVRARLRASPAS